MKNIFARNDDHKSEYEKNFLIKYHSAKTKIVLLDRKTFSKQLKDGCQLKLTNFTDNRDVKKSLHVHRILFIDGAIGDSQKATKTFVWELFAIRKAFLGEMWTFSEAQKDLNISAYTSGSS